MTETYAVAEPTHPDQKTSEELKREREDWEIVGNRLGYELAGWTGRHSADFMDQHGRIALKLTSSVHVDLLSLMLDRTTRADEG